MIYLDHNATTPIDPRVAAAVAECYAAGHVNPASPHAGGRTARRVLETARDGIAELLGINNSEYDAPRLIFTSGGTEANNLAIRGLSGASGRVLISAIEHPSVTGAGQFMHSMGRHIDILPALPTGVVDLNALPELISQETALVSVMLGNNETGVLQPLNEITKICGEAGIPVHTDAVQAAGKIPLSFPELGVAAMTVSAHKFHGPRGVGVLVVEEGRKLDPILHGGAQQQGYRPGTESVALAVGMHVALEIWKTESAARYQGMKSARDRLERLLVESEIGAEIIGQGAERLPHTTNVAFPGLDRQALVMALDQHGLCCSTGSACASGSSEPSPVLMAMGLEKEVIDGSLRLSLGATTMESEIDSAVEIISRVTKDLRRSSEARKSSAPSR